MGFVSSQPLEDPVFKWSLYKIRRHSWFCRCCSAGLPQPVLNSYMLISPSLSIYDTHRYLHWLFINGRPFFVVSRFDLYLTNQNAFCACVSGNMNRNEEIWTTMNTMSDYHNINSFLILTLCRGPDGRGLSIQILETPLFHSLDLIFPFFFFFLSFTFLVSDVCRRNFGVGKCVRLPG